MILVFVVGDLLAHLVANLLSDRVATYPKPLDIETVLFDLGRYIDPSAAGDRYERHSRCKSKAKGTALSSFRCGCSVECVVGLCR